MSAQDTGKNIWAKCPKNNDVRIVEADVEAFLKDFGLDKQFSVPEIEGWIYECSPGEEDTLFNPLLDAMPAGTLEDLSRFDALFRKKLFAHVPQKMLNGFSPIKYTLRLKKLSTG